MLDGTLELLGNYSVDDIGNLEFLGGEVIHRGNILNQGKTIVQNPSTGVWKLRAHIYGGRIETSGGVCADVAGVLDNVTLAGDAVVFDDFSSTATGKVTTPNTLTFDGGTLTIERFAEFSVAQHISLAGKGQIILNSNPQDSLIQTYTGGQITIGPDIIVRSGPDGGGTISRSNLPVINHGTISAETFGQELVVAGALTNTGVLQARENGTLRIDADNWTNEGTMHVDQGVIVLRSGTVTNGPNAIVSGEGGVEFLQTQFTNQGTISPGIPIGRLTFIGGLSLGNTSEVMIELAGDTANKYDVIQVEGDIQLGGKLHVALIDGFALRDSQRFTILNIVGEVTGGFEGLSEGDLVGNFGNRQLHISYKGGDGNDVVLYTPVPEPGEWTMVLIICISAFLFPARYTIQHSA